MFLTSLKSNPLTENAVCSFKQDNTCSKTSKIFCQNSPIWPDSLKKEVKRPYISEKVGTKLNVDGKSFLFYKYSDRKTVGLVAFYSKVPCSLLWHFQC